MPFVTIAERVGMEKGLLEGIEVVLPEIREIQDHEALRKILWSLTTARSTDQVRRICERARRPGNTRRK